MRARILSELRRRRDAWEPNPTLQDLVDVLGTNPHNMSYHLRILRGAGLVHPAGIAITAKGYDLAD